MQINDDEVKLVLSKNIKSARAISGFTQETLAEDSDISVGFLKDIESTRSGVSLSTLITLCKSLDTTPNQVLKDFCEKYKKYIDDVEEYKFELLRNLIKENESIEIYIGQSKA